MITLSELSPNIHSEEASALREKPRSTLLEELAIGLFALCLGLYFVARYDGLWLDEATARLVANASQTDITKHLSSNTSDFGSVLLLKTLADFTGISILNLTQMVLPLLVVLVAFATIAFYKNALLDRRLALFSAFCLFTQPAFITAILAGATKFSWVLVLMCLTVVFAKREHSTLQSDNIIKSNFVLGVLWLTLFSFDWFLAVYLLILLVVGLILFRLGTIVFARNLIAFRLAKFIPALGFIAIFALVYSLFLNPSVLNRLSGQTGLDFLPSLNDWVSFPVYAALNVVMWFLGLLSVIQWLILTTHYLRRKVAPSTAALLLWAFYTCNVLLLSLSPLMPTAYSNAVIAFSLIFSVPMALTLLFELVNRATRISGKILIGFGLTLLLLWSGITAALVGTGEPLYNKQWQYYSDSEVAALRWSEQFLERESIWTGSDNQLVTVFAVLNANKNSYYGGAVNSKTCCVLVSQRLQALASWMGWALPDTLFSKRLYDNGKAWVFR